MRVIWQIYHKHISHISHYETFHTIDHVILFYILAKYVGLWGKALDLIKSYVLCLMSYCSVCNLMAFSVNLQRLYVEFQKGQF